MPAWKVTWFFEGNQLVTSGSSPLVTWTETWYESQSATIDAALRTAVDPNNGYLPRRLAFTPNIYRPTHVRVSEANNPRFSKYTEVRNMRGFLAHTDAARTAAQVTCALLVNFTVLPAAPGDVTHHRMFLIRGLPESLINGNSLRRNSTVFRELQSFLNWLGYQEGPIAAPLGDFVPNLAAAFGGWYQLRYFGQASVNAAITALAVDAGGRTITITSALAADRGDRVSVTGVTFPRGVNRIWTVQSALPGEVYQLGKSRARLAGAWDAGTGSAKKIAYQFRKPDQYVITGLRTRQTGKTVFQGPVGRRSRG